MKKDIDPSVIEKMRQEILILRRGLYEAAVELLNNSKSKEVIGTDGKEYQVCITAFYDDKRLKTIRVTTAIYRPKELKWWRIGSYIDSPIISESYIIASDDKFVGE